jgi:hypothetical protein
VSVVQQVQIEILILRNKLVTVRKDFMKSVRKFVNPAVNNVKPALDQSRFVLLAILIIQTD